MSLPPALTPAKALPWELGLCSRSWKPEAWAWGAKAPAAMRVNAVRVRRERWVMGAWLLIPEVPGWVAVGSRF